MLPFDPDLRIPLIASTPASQVCLSDFRALLLRHPVKPQAINQDVDRDRSTTVEGYSEAALAAALRMDPSVKSLPCHPRKA